MTTLVAVSLLLLGLLGYARSRDWRALAWAAVGCGAVCL